jgi:hypothetical protein
MLLCVEECIDKGRGEVQEELHKEHQGEEARRDDGKCRDLIENKISWYPTHILSSVRTLVPLLVIPYSLTELSPS